MDKPQKTETEQVDFFERCYERFLKALRSAGEVRRSYRIGETSVCLLFAGERLIPYITPALEHLRMPDGSHADVTMCIWDSDSTSVEMIPPPCKWESFTDRGDIWGFNSSRIRTAFHWVECSVNLMDHRAGIGMYWVKTAENLPYWVHASPLKTLFHWWMEKNGCHIIHAAAVATDAGAVLLTGEGGSGKSTTALSCLQSGFYYLSDDFMIARLEPRATAYTLYSTAKLNQDNLHNFPVLKKLVQNPEKLDQEKAIIFLQGRFEKQIISEMPIRAVFIPRITYQDTSSLVPASPFEIRQSAGFSTMSLLPGAGRYTHNFMCRLSLELPGYILQLGRNLEEIPASIGSYLSGKSAQELNRHDRPRKTGRQDVLPLVSVIVPVYNGERFIRDAVNNIWAQNYPSLELIIVNDGSTDRTEEIIRGMPADIRYFKQDTEGAASARNRGIRDASGEFIAFLDVDDLWPVNNLHMLVNEMLREPDTEVIHGYAQLMQFNTERNEFEYTGNPKESFPYYIGAGIYRKSVFETVGLFDPTLRFGEDRDWYNRAHEADVKVKRVDDITLFVRRHGRNMTNGKNRIELGMLRIYKKFLDRKRSKSGN
jgi:GT2 family glycosyltransferase